MTLVKKTYKIKSLNSKTYMLLFLREKWDKRQSSIMRARPISLNFQLSHRVVLMLMADLNSKPRVLRSCSE